MYVPVTYDFLSFLLVLTSDLIIYSHSNFFLNCRIRFPTLTKNGCYISRPVGVQNETFFSMFVRFFQLCNSRGEKFIQTVAHFCVRIKIKLGI